ncbi:MAG: PHP domain-containing protein [Polyangiaceae bacterium]|nr:PHP domain-containing protein [Polyangiaceae bacterium]
MGVRGAVSAAIGAIALVIVAAVLVGRRQPALPPPELPQTTDALPFPPVIARRTFDTTLDVSTFQRGNIHAHSSWSDGDRPPRDVYIWYRNHGFAFVAITDHNSRTSPQTFKALEKKSFVIIAGEELTMSVANKRVHVNGLCTKKTIGGGRQPSIRAALVHAIEHVHAQGGVALINHPNFDWALTADDIRNAKGAELIEIYSSHPHVNSEGDAQRPSHEAMWDALLDQGEDIGGVAVDDAHYFNADKPNTSNPAKPGLGWVEVFASRLDRNVICEALRNKQLYSSSGATLSRIRVTADALSVWPKDQGATVEFIGDGGKVFEKKERSADGETTYQLRGTERYVRARITLPDGKKAWTQAYRTNVATN